MSSERPPVVPYGFGENYESCMDRRLFNTEFGSFAHEAGIPASQEQHRSLRDSVVRRIRLSAGLEPGIDFLPLEPEITSLRSIDGVAVSNVVIRTLPGLRLTGNLFMPEHFSGKLPGVLCPHGHWPNGRVHHAPDGGVVMRCMELARLGFAVFAYDMVGYNDNNDIPHRWDTAMRRENYHYGISPFGLQTANSMRAVDFMVSLPEVDPGRIGCTGASGGASQTWFISALDQRIKVICPVCMLSLHYAGGCMCEEGPLLRTSGLTSFDIVSSLAPRPILLPGVTGDWTNLNPDYEIPKLKEVYKLYYAEDKVEHFYYEDSHNYNRRTREHVYAWLVRQLQNKDMGSTIPESTDRVPAPEQLWHNGSKPEPPSAETFAKVKDELIQCYTGKALEWGSDFTLWQNRNCDLLRQMLEREFSAADVVERVTHGSWNMPEGRIFSRMISRREVGDAIMGMLIKPAGSGDCKNGIVYPVEKSVQDYFNDGPMAQLTFETIMKCRSHTLLFELMGSGFRAAQLEHCCRRENNPVDPAFNDSFFAMRVQDIVTCGVLMKERGYRITLAAPAVNTPALLAASALLGCCAVIDLTGVDDECWNDKFNNQPLMGKLGGIKGLALLNVRNNVTFCGVSGELKELLNSCGAVISEKQLWEIIR